jgi:hypothetical protein
MIPARFSESEAVTVQRLRMRHRFPDLRWDAQADPVVLPDTADVGSALTWAPPRSTSTGPHAAPATLRVDREGIHLSGATPGAWYRIPVGASPFLRPDGTDVVSRTDSGRIAIKPSQSQATLRYLPFRPVLPFLAVSALGVVALLGLAVCRMGGPGRRAEAFDRA